MDEVFRHEAAHAVVALAFGCGAVSITVGHDGSGHAGAFDQRFSDSWRPRLTVLYAGAVGEAIDGNLDRANCQSDLAMIEAWRAAQHSENRRIARLAKITDPETLRLLQQGVDRTTVKAALDAKRLLQANWRAWDRLSMALSTSYYDGKGALDATEIARVLRGTRIRTAGDRIGFTRLVATDACEPYVDVFVSTALTATIWRDDCRKRQAPDRSLETRGGTPTLVIWRLGAAG